MKRGPIGDAQRVKHLTGRLYELNSQFTERANRFSVALGEGSRTIKALLTLANLVAAGTLILLTVWRIRRLVLQREAFENALKAEKERLAWQATHDPMTGLANRRDFEVRLEHELGEAGRAPLALILLDLDQFKVVNDTCGHLAGDRLLSDVARLLNEGRRPHDHVARLGGDEFGIILPRCTPYEAVDIAEQLRRSFELFSFTWEDRCFAVTASIGLACIADRTITLEEALRRADAACYGAKQKGRNRVQVYPMRPEVVAAGSAKRQTAGI
jgi:diguanylate cyclase (GGDEF)-like protein